MRVKNEQIWRIFAIFTKWPLQTSIKSSNEILESSILLCKPSSHWIICLFWGGFLRLIVTEKHDPQNWEKWKNDACRIWPFFGEKGVHSNANISICFYSTEKFEISAESENWVGFNFFDVISLVKTNRKSWELKNWYFVQKIANDSISWYIQMPISQRVFIVHRSFKYQQNQ